MTKEERWKHIEILSDLRAKYSCFDDSERPYYEALSDGIKAIKALEQEPTTKNDLGVDCISRADVNQVIEDYMDEQYRVLSDRTRERAFGANAVKARINELQTVTLELKIGHERLTNSEWIDFLSEQFDISRTSAKKMLHTMMLVKKEDNFKKLFSQGEGVFGQGFSQGRK